jgi:hypothetical protein
MFGSPEIYLQAEMRYHHEQIRARFADADVRRRWVAVRPRSLLSGRSKPTPASVTH